MAKLISEYSDDRKTQNIYIHEYIFGSSEVRAAAASLAIDFRFVGLPSSMMI